MTETQCDGEEMTGMRPVYQKHGPTQRGWLMLGTNGGPCDKSCQMCYYRHETDKRWFAHESLLNAAHRIRHYYGLEYCTLSGGEPTIYPRIVGLVRHCANIGLQPLINTHGQHCDAEFVAQVEEAGLAHWIVSVQGLGDEHDIIINDPGGWQRTTENLKHMTRPVLINTTVMEQNYLTLPSFATWLIDNLEPTVWHMLNFLPFGWEGKDAPFEAKLENMGKYIATAILFAEAAGWEVNVQYHPFCVAADFGFERNVKGFYQGQWSPWDWCVVTSQRVPLEMVREVGGMEAARRKIVDGLMRVRRNEVCDTCRFQPICEMISPDYAKRHGYDELTPVEGEPVTDILYFENGGEFQ